MPQTSLKSNFKPCKMYKHPSWKLMHRHKQTNNFYNANNLKPKISAIEHYTGNKNKLTESIHLYK